MRIMKEAVSRSSPLDNRGLPNLRSCFPYIAARGGNRCTFPHGLGSVFSALIKTNHHFVNSFKERIQ